jgi:hypothetical protein
MWIRTDDLQFVKKNDDDNYEVIETTTLHHNSTKYVVQHLVIDINEYDLENEISSYYDSVQQVKDIYKEDWKQIVAECIAEQSSMDNDDFSCTTKEELLVYFKTKYDIEI